MLDFLLSLLIDTAISGTHDSIAAETAVCYADGKQVPCDSAPRAIPKPQGK
jgi:hypothetical protein